LLALGEQPVSAARRQAGQRAHVLRRELHAILDALEAVLVIRASAQPRIEQPAADRGPVDLAGVLVFELCHAAFAAAVAKRLPLRRGHLLQRLGLPEGCGVHGTTMWS